MTPIYRIPPYRLDTESVTRSALGERIDWGLHSQGIPDVWRDASGEGILVGIIDTDGDADHPDLPKPQFKHNFSRSRTGRDRQGHGLHVAGIVAARSNGKGVVGVAPKCDIGVIKGLGDDGSGQPDRLAQAIDRCVREGCHVINMSWGGGYSPTIEHAIQEAAAKGVLCIAAAGNSGGIGVDYPGRLVDTLAVASYNQDGEVSSYSSRGPEVDFACPGERVTSCWIGGRYQTISGTSMATPFASGVAALYLSAGGEAMTAAEIRPHLAGITTDHGRAGRDHSSGWGLLDLKKIIGRPEEPAEVNGFRVIARGSGLEIQLV